MMANGFMNRLEGLLSGQNTLGNLGLGLLAASGPSTQPQSFGQVLGQGMQFASERQQQAQQNQFLRDQMLQKKKQGEAQQKLHGLLDSGGDPNQMLGLLAQASPEAFSQAMTTGILGQMFPGPQQERAEPASIREMRTLGFPLTQEGFANYKKVAEEGNASEELLTQIQLQSNMLALEESQRKNREAERSLTQQYRIAETGTATTLSYIKKAAELNQRLAPTMLRSGANAQETRRALSEGIAEIQSVFGVDTSEARQLHDDYDTFQKLNSRLIVDAMSGIGGEGMGPATNDKLRLLNQSMAGTGISPGANAQIYADTINELLNIAQIEGFDVGDRDEFMSFAEQLRQPINQQAAAGGIRFLGFE